MSQTPWQWTRLQQTMENLPKENKASRLGQAKIAVSLIDQILETKYHLTNEKIFDEFEGYSRVAYAYLQGDPFFVQESAEKYFLRLHAKSTPSSTSINVSFVPKKSGVQIGFICHVKIGTQTNIYYLKTHQNGPTSGNPQSYAPPDLKEVFIYKLLHRIGMGPETHFIFPNTARPTLLIATKGCDIVLLSNLTEKSASLKALIQLDLISRILCLRDCGTNASNCGQVGDKPMIVDFRIETQLDYLKPDILDKFYEGNGEFNYLGLMESAIKLPKQEKFEIMKESLKEWGLEANIDKVVSETKEATPLSLKTDLPTYVENVKVNLKILNEATVPDK